MEREQVPDFTDWEKFRTTEQYKTDLMSELRAAIVAELVKKEPDIEENDLDFIYNSVNTPEEAQAFMEDRNLPPKIETLTQEFEKNYTLDKCATEKSLKKFYDKIGRKLGTKKPEEPVQ